MSGMLASLIPWFAGHPILEGVAWAMLVALVGAFVNWVTYKRTPEEWAAYQLAHPWRATLIRICRVIFPHLKKIPQIAALFPVEEDKPKSAPKPPVLPLLMLGALGLLSGCSSWFTPARGAAAAELTACVLEHWGEPAEEVAIDCSADVVDVMRVQKAAAKSMTKGAPLCEPKK